MAIQNCTCVAGSAGSTANVKFMPKPAEISKRVTRVEFTSTVIQTLLAGQGGTIEVPTTGFTGLNVFDQKYWSYHTPYGAPGDELWVAEKYRIIQSTCTLDGVEVTAEFEDKSTCTFQSKYPVALTKAGCWISAQSMPYELSRLKLVIEDVVCTADGSKWQLTVSHLNADDGTSGGKSIVYVNI